MFDGLIYKCTCKTTAKVYIGQTIQKLKRRIGDHIKVSMNPKDPGYNYHFHRAIRKYGKDDFEWIVLEEISAESIEVLKELLNILEIEYVSKYDSFTNGYNSTKGGDGCSRVCRSVDVYNESGNLIETYESASVASNALEVTVPTIRTICNRLQTHTYKNGNKLIFRYSDDILTENELTKVKQNNFRKIICMYNTEGECVTTYSDATIAANNLEIGYNSIVACCNRTRNFVSIKGVKYIFRYDGDFITEKELLKVNSIKSIPNKPVRAVDSVTNEVLGEFKSLSDGARAFNIANKGNVIEASQGKRKTAGKFNGHGIKWVLI